ncbi:MAG TPA: NAD(P)-dependent oxidoreductase [Actinomycetota bacterium]|nr:NAD(P)-dependent oxidoreductase [Actinomycetota bacterium]
MTAIGFCGLGRMGAPMAARLIEAGHDVTVWNRTRERAEPLAERGAKVADSPAEAAAEAEALITILTDAAAVEAVAFGPNGAAGAVRSDSTLIEMSTIGPDAVRAVRERLPEGVRMIDAPVLGGVSQAEAGELNVLVGADDDDLARHRGVLETFGRVTHIGPPGSGAAMKLVANSTLGALVATLGEALALGDTLDLDEGMVLDVLMGTPMAIVIERQRAMIESASYPPAFALSLARKDLHLVAEAAASRERELRVAPASEAWLADAERAGLGDLNYSAVVAHIRGRPANG